MTQKREIEKHRDIFSTIIYTDEALREFFKNYTKRTDYANTIFFITGDHSMPELNPGNHFSNRKIPRPLYNIYPRCSRRRIDSTPSPHTLMSPLGSCQHESKLRNFYRPCLSLDGIRNGYLILFQKYKDPCIYSQQQGDGGLCKGD